MSQIFRLIGLLVCLFPSMAIQGQDGVSVFKQHCAACHTIGGGRLVGPDLAGVMQQHDRVWVERFILNSVAMISSGDPAAVATSNAFGGILMPPFAGTRQELSGVLQYLETVSGSAVSAVPDTFLLAASQENVTRGEILFSGRSGFTNGGPSCVSCHSIHGLGHVGGTMARSLTFSWYTMKGQGIQALLGSPPFPAMTAAYLDKPLTGQEIYEVAAFMKHAAMEMVSHPLHDRNGVFPWISFAGLGIVILILAGLRIRQKRFSVNKGIIKRQTPTDSNHP